MTYRSGFAAFVGRPNAGKSTLINAMVGSKVVITSDKPQTTRRAVRAVLSRPDGQLIVVDTPGLHRPRTLLGQRLNDVVHETLGSVDVIGFCLPANEHIGPGDRFIAAELAKLSVPVVAVITKTDLASRAQVADALQRSAALHDFAEYIPVSAKVNDQVSLLADLLVGILPEGPQLYPDDAATDDSPEAAIADIVREAALARVEQELPHSIAVTVTEILPRADKDLTDVFATIHLERTSQRPIVLGQGGQVLKAIGTQARPSIERLLGTRVNLRLHISVLADWQRDPKKLDRLGF